MSLEYVRDSKKPIYISTDVMRGLWLLSKAKDNTPDEIADAMIRDALHREYPYLIEFQDEENKREKEFLKHIGGPTK